MKQLSMLAHRGILQILCSIKIDFGNIDLVIRMIAPCVNLAFTRANKKELLNFFKENHHAFI